MFRITKLTDYATVVLAELASAGDGLLSASEVADRTGLEPPTVAKVLKPLAQAGLVEGFRGVRGGYRLARAPRAMRLIDVIEAMEGPVAVTECTVHSGQCGLEASCGMRSNWRRINDLIAGALDNVTLHDLLPPGPGGGRTHAKRIDVRLAQAER